VSRHPVPLGIHVRPYLLLALLIVVVGACGGPVLANPPAAHPVVTPAPAATAGPADPVPVQFPRDDAPHDRLTEWWYYTGHLRSFDGHRFGFEFVVFRAERGGFPVTWASHLGLTDEGGRAFHYAQRSEIGAQVDHVPGGPGGPSGFAFVIAGSNAVHPSAPVGSPWTMAGEGGMDTLSATAVGKEVDGDPISSFGIDLALSARKPPVLQDGDGWIDFGPAGSSYYVSRTDMAASGTIVLGDKVLSVDGTAWFDHQWGDFISVGGGGWDWFAVNLDDGTDIMISLVRAADGSYPLAYGTVVDAAGRSRHLGGHDIDVRSTDSWLSPATGARYPAGWRLRLASEGLDISLQPSVPQQELDTRATTGVVYWEGSQRVTGTRDAAPVGGEAYVELTGYADRP
jgi:predicted secreted hydrolase